MSRLLPPKKKVHPGYIAAALRWLSKFLSELQNDTPQPLLAVGGCATKAVKYEKTDPNLV